MLVLFLRYFYLFQEIQGSYYTNVTNAFLTNKQRDSSYAEFHATLFVYGWLAYCYIYLQTIEIVLIPMLIFLLIISFISKGSAVVQLYGAMHSTRALTRGPLPNI